MKIKITLNELSRGSVFISDMEVPCRALSYDATVPQSPRLILDLIGEVEIQGEADTFLRLPDGSRLRIVPDNEAN